MPRNGSNSVNNDSAEGLYLDPPTNKWRIGKRLGSGACGSVHILEKCNASTSSGIAKYAVKLAKLPPSTRPTKSKKKKTAVERNADILYHENMLYRNVLNDLRGTVVPDVPLFGGGKCPPQCFGDIDGYRFLVMEQMENSLQSMVPSLLQNHYRKNSRNTSTSISIGPIFARMVELLQSIHENRLLFVDVKPDNFMLAFPSSKSSRAKASISAEEVAKNLRIIDVGLIERYEEMSSNKSRNSHRSDLYPDAQMVGTPNYASLNVMGGHTPSRRDDLESLGYVLSEIILMFHHLDTVVGKGGDIKEKNVDSSTLLPWSHGKSDEDIYRLKCTAMGERNNDDDDDNHSPKSNRSGGGKKILSLFEIMAESGNQSVCRIMKEYFEIVRNIAYKEKPDYEELKKLLTRVKIKVSGGSGSAVSKDSSISISSERKSATAVKPAPRKKRAAKESSAAVEDTDTNPISLVIAAKKVPTKRKTRTSAKAEKSSSVTLSIVVEKTKRKSSKRSETKVAKKIIVLDSDEDDSNGEDNNGEDSTCENDESEVENISPPKKAKTTESIVNSTDDDCEMMSVLEYDPAESVEPVNFKCSDNGIDDDDSFKSCQSSPENVSDDSMMEWEDAGTSGGSDENNSSFVNMSNSGDGRVVVGGNESVRSSSITSNKKKGKGIAASSPSLQLIFVDGPHKGESFILTDTTTVGRKLSKSKVKRPGDQYEVVRDGQVSSSHIKMVLNRSKAGLSIRVIDLKSTNGTLVNDKLLPTGGGKQVFSGDKIQIGESVIRVKKV